MLCVLSAGAAVLLTVLTCLTRGCGLLPWRKASVLSVLEGVPLSLLHQCIPQLKCETTGNTARANLPWCQPCFGLFPKDWHGFPCGWRGHLCLPWSRYIAKPSSRPQYDKTELERLSLLQSVLEPFSINVPAVPSVCRVCKLRSVSSS